MKSFLRQCDDATGCNRIYPADLSNCPKCGAPEALSTHIFIDPKYYSYDIETYPNVFSCRITHLATGSKWCFQITDWLNEWQQFHDFIMQLRACNALMVGYNNLSFDYPVIHFICRLPNASADDIYHHAQKVIKASNAREWTYNIHENEMLVQQLDLLKLNHFDNKAKMTSLKALEFAMRMESVDDLPFDFRKPLSAEQLPVLLHYNDHDVEATSRFFVRCSPMIELREKLSKTFNTNFMNMNDVKMGATLLIRELEQQGIQCYERTHRGGHGSPRQTHRASIALGEVIFPYIKFERPEFEAIRDWISKQVIRETKGVFNDLTPTQAMLQFRDKSRTKVKIDGKWKNESKTDQQGSAYQFEKLHAVIDGYTYYLGTGGIHGSVESTIIRSSETHQIVDVDVASFYPNLAIVNRLYPAHLGEQFCDAYLNVYETRTTYPKKTPENEAYKLALNGTYGGSNDQFSPFYDPKYTMSITINGQLLLCMLAEQLLKIPGLRMIQSNTDGLTFLCPVEYLDHQKQIQKWWMQVTRLELEQADYSMMAIRDVNSYIAVTESGYVKRIGTYAHVTPDQQPGTREVAWHKDPSMLIVPKAAEAVLVHGKDLETFIREHRDMFDFMIRAKVPRADKLVMRYPEWDVELPMPNITRYFASTTGGQLIKVASPKGKPGTWKRKNGVSDAEYEDVLKQCKSALFRLASSTRDADNVVYDERIHTKAKSVHPESTETGMCAGQSVTQCNHIRDFDWDLVDYDYYIAEAKKIIEPLLTPPSE